MEGRRNGNKRLMVNYLLMPAKYQTYQMCIKMMLMIANTSQSIFIKRFALSNNGYLCVCVCAELRHTQESMAKHQM